MNDLKEQLKQENNQLNEQLHCSQHVGDIIYQSQVMEELLQQVELWRKVTVPSCFAVKQVPEKR